MSPEPGNPPQTHLSVLSTAPPESPPTGDEGLARRSEAQLRARLDRLETALADVSSCLEDAERRGAELLASRARVEALEEKLTVIITSKSWRLTTPLRRVMERARPSAGR